MLRSEVARLEHCKTFNIFNMKNIEVLREIAKALAKRVEKGRFAELAGDEDPINLYTSLRDQGLVEADKSKDSKKLKMPCFICITTKGEELITGT